MRVCEAGGWKAVGDDGTADATEDAVDPAEEDDVVEEEDVVEVEVEEALMVLLRFQQSGWIFFCSSAMSLAFCE